MEDLNRKNRKIFISGFNSKQTSGDEFRRVFGKYGKIESMIVKDEYAFIGYDHH